jgi:hypothetical protein
MQKLINVLAVIGFLGTAGMAGVGVYVYLNKDALIDNAVDLATEAATGAVMDALPGLIGGAMPDIPEMPTKTGPALPF